MAEQGSAAAGPAPLLHEGRHLSPSAALQEQGAKPSGPGMAFLWPPLHGIALHSKGTSAPSFPYTIGVCFHSGYGTLGLQLGQGLVLAGTPSSQQSLGTCCQGLN